MTRKPDHAELFGIAAGQLGYFTTDQARSAGIGSDLLSYHTSTGRFIRVKRGVYRFRDFPSSPHEDVMATWLAAGKDIAVVSHDSALDLLDLSDVIPDAIHLTVPRSKRYIHPPAGVEMHTTTRPVRHEEMTVRDGIRLTDATRTILDAAEVGIAPEQVELAVAQALERGLTTITRLRTGARDRSQRVNQLIRVSIDRHAA